MSKNVGYLGLFLGGFVGICIGAVVLLIDRNSFPIFAEEMLVGSLSYNKKEYIFLMQGTKASPTVMQSTLIDGQDAIEATHTFTPYHSWLAFGEAYSPITLTVDKKDIAVVGRKRAEGFFSGELLDSNRNSVGSWQLSSVEGIGAKSPVDLGYVSNALNTIYNEKTLAEQHALLKSQQQKLEEDIEHAKAFLGNASNLAKEVELKLKEARKQKEEANKLLKVSQGTLDRLRDRILVTQRVSPQGKFYDESLESLRLEKTWFLSAFALAKEKNAE